MTLLVVGLVIVAFGLGVAVARASRPKGPSEREVKRGRLCFELAEGDVENVAAELERLAEQEPADHAAFLTLAALDRRRGRFERAKALHRAVLASSTLPVEDRVAAFVGLGRDLLAQGNERAAVGALVRAVSLAPRSVATLETLARSLEAAGAWDRAAAAWERHEKLVEGRRRREARVSRGHALAGVALEALSEGDRARALRLVDRAIGLAPDSGHAWYVRARILAAHVLAGEAAFLIEALACWQRAWELSPAGAESIVGLAVSWSSETKCRNELEERMLASLEATVEVPLVVALASRLQTTRPVEARRALERTAVSSDAARILLARALLGPDDASAEVHAVLSQELAPSWFVCRVCGLVSPRFEYRCAACGNWDRAAILAAPASSRMGRAVPQPPVRSARSDTSA